MLILKGAKITSKRMRLCVFCIHFSFIQSVVGSNSQNQFSNINLIIPFIDNRKPFDYFPPDFFYFRWLTSIIISVQHKYMMLCGQLKESSEFKSPHFGSNLSKSQPLALTKMLVLEWAIEISRFFSATFFMLKKVFGKSLW